jgi:hypothetical protein
MVVKTLTVTVENRAPVRKTPLMVPGLESVRAAVGHPTLKTKNDEIPEVALMLYKVSVAPGGFFKDDDAADILTYEITSERQDVVIQAGTACAVSPCEVWLDIVTRRGSVNEFNLHVVAVDSAKEKSPVLAFPYRSADPVAQTYTTAQFATTDDFRAITVGRREGVGHKLIFDAVPMPDGTAGTANGFAFAHAWVAKVEALNTTDTVNPNPNVTTDGTSATVPPKNVAYGVSVPPTPVAGAAVNGTVIFYTVKATGSVTAPNALTISTTSDQPEMTFKVDGPGAGTIEVGFHIWYDQDGTGVGGEKHTAKWHSAKETLTVTVVPVK